MIIYNKQNIITNKQIEKCIRKYNKDLLLDDIKIVIREESKYMFEIDFLPMVVKIAYYIKYRGSEGACSPLGRNIFVNAYNIDGNVQDKRLYGIGVLIHEIQHLLGNKNEEECDDEAIRFLNNNSKFLKEVLNLKNEYIVEDF